MSTLSVDLGTPGDRSIGLQGRGRNPDLERKRDSLIAAGREKKVALTAIVRRFIVMTNAFKRDRRR